MKYIRSHWKHVFLASHVGYFSSVAMTGHGLYTIAAGIMAALVVFGSIFHLDMEG